MQAKQDADADSSFLRACFGRDYRGCLSAAYMNTAKRAPKPNDKMQRMYQSRGLNGLKKGCSTKDAEACEVLGDWYSGKFDPAVTPPPPPRRPPPAPPKH